MMKCPECNFENSDKSKFCMGCGKKFIVTPPVQMAQDKPTAIPLPSEPFSRPPTQSSLLEKLQASYESEAQTNSFPEEIPDPKMSVENREKIGWPGSQDDANHVSSSKLPTLRDSNPTVDGKLPSVPKIQSQRAFKKNSTYGKNLLTNDITPADAEISVRSYRCSYYKSWLIGFSADGMLNVTNKRVIYQASGSSITGRSVIQSEVPIADVSGISSYKGTYFSLWSLIGALFLSFIISSLVAAIITFFGLQNGVQVLKGLAWAIGIGTGLGSLAVSFEKIWRSVLAFTASIMVGLAGGGSQISSYMDRLNPMNILFGAQTSNQSSGWEFILAMLVFIYALYCMIQYSRKPTFSVSVNSKGGSSTPINISKASGIGVFDISVNNGLNATPAVDSDTMLQELGAVIMDIQTLGDLGINKWSSF